MKSCFSVTDGFVTDAHVTQTSINLNVLAFGALVDRKSAELGFAARDILFK